MAQPHPLDVLIQELEDYRDQIKDARDAVKGIRTGGLHKDIDVRRAERRGNAFLASVEDLISKIKRIEKYIEG